MFLILGAICLFTVAGVDGQCSEVCYDEIECFTTCPPFSSFPLPQSPAFIGTTFRLFTQSNQASPVFITAADLGPFVAKKTVFLTHGFIGSGADEWIIDAKNSLLEVEDQNVIVVDWEEGSFPDVNNPFEAVPAANTQVVARLLRNLFNAMKTRGMSEDMVSCVGHSVGAHLCAFFGKEFTGPRIGRITGLDPAGDLFSTDETRVRLNPTDADFVDAIHTDAWSLFSAGIDRNVGHQDFWPNYGDIQPGCFETVCSHFISTEFYVESIKSNCGFQSRPCVDLDDMYSGNCASSTCSGDDCGTMGYFASSRSQLEGTFFLETNANVPYCQNCCF